MPGGERFYAAGQMGLNLSCILRPYGWGLCGAALQIKTAHQRREKYRNFRFNRELPAAEGMVEGNHSGMKSHAGLRFIFLPIFYITDDRVSDAGKMNSYLVLPAR